jgi:cullin 1
VFQKGVRGVDGVEKALTHERAKDAVLELIARERENEPIERDLIKSVLTIFVDVGMDRGTDVYENNFQAPLLASIHSHYKTKAALWIQSESCSEYLIKAEQSLADEEERATYYMHPNSKAPVVDAVQAELLKNVQMQLIEKDTGCNAMLRDNKTDDLRRMFKLFHRCGASSIIPLAEIFRKHIEEEGMALLNQVKASAEAGEGPGGHAARKESANAEQQFIRNILSLQVPLLL